MNAASEGVGRPLLSIVIVSWNTCDALRTCLRSVKAHSDAEVQIVVVDNASGDDSVQMVRREFPDVQMVVNDSNRGFAVASNQGMRAAKGTFLLLLNSDTYVVDDVIVRLARHLEERPEIAVASCQLRYPDGRAQHTAARALSIFRSLFEDLWLYKLVSPRLRDEMLLGAFWNGASEREVDWLAGAFMMLRHEVFEQSGGFDEDFFMYGEDCEWCMRLRRSGYRIFYIPLGAVTHVGSVSSDQSWNEQQRMRRCHFGGFKAYEKINGKIMGVLYRLARLLGSATRWSAYSLLLLWRPRPYLLAQRRSYRWQISFCIESFFVDGVDGRRSRET
jgi:GT2 family glycosyltransferase